MNEGIEMDEDRTGHNEVERRLRAYADARLSPSPETTARMRAAIVAHADAIAAGRVHPLDSAATRAVERPSTIQDRRPWLVRSRKAAALLLAATVAAGSAAAVFAATPGSPLYPTRLWFEALTLPASGDARAAAQVDDLDQRLAEAQTAAMDGDSNAIASALAAFRDEIAAALQGADNNPARLAHLETALANHVAALRALEAGAPPSAISAIESAITASMKAVAQIEAKAGGAPAPHPTPAGPPAHATPRP